MSGTGSLLIAIPTYNERENIGALLPALLALHPDAHVVVIDDNSPDGTGDIVAALARARPADPPHPPGPEARARQRVSHRLRVGARARVRARRGDGRRPLPRSRRDRAACWRRPTAPDVVVGSRYVPGGRIENWPWSRRALSGGANALARLMVGREVHDWTAGFKCYSRAALASLELDRIRSEGYSFQVEILFHCRRAGWKIQEVPITFVDRRLGRTKMSRREVYQAMVTLLRIAWRRLAG